MVEAEIALSDLPRSHSTNRYRLTCGLLRMIQLM